MTTVLDRPKMAVDPDSDSDSDWDRDWDTPPPLVADSDPEEDVDEDTLVCRWFCHRSQTTGFPRPSTLH